MPFAFLNNCRWVAASSGTGSFVVSLAVSGGYTPADCVGPVMVDGATYRYFAVNPNDAAEHMEGDGVWTSGTSTLTRGTIRNGTNGVGINVTFTDPPIVHMGGAVADDVSRVRNMTGSLSRFGRSAAVDGYVRADGANYAQAAKPDLYAAIGGAYARSTNVHINGRPWRQRWLHDDPSPADVTSWTTGTSIPAALAQSQAIVTKDRVYLLGGYDNSAYVATVYTAPINSDGTLGTWTTGTSLPGPLGQSQAVVTKDRVYLLGGYNNSAYVATVYTAPINSDGTLGAWTTGTSLPGALGDSQAIVTKDRVYLLSGYNGTAFAATVYTAPINSDGTLGAWTTGTSLPGALGRSQAVVTKDRVYLLGGNTGSPSSVVYTAPFSGGGANDYMASGYLAETAGGEFAVPDLRQGTNDLGPRLPWFVKE